MPPRTDDPGRKFYWVVLTPSAVETVAYLSSDIASSVASTVITNSYLAVLVVNSQWTPKRTVAAYFVQHRNSAEELETFHPIHPSMLESREPIIPPPSFADFGECVLDTSRRAMFDGVYEGELDTRNLIPPECLGSFPTQRWLDMDLEFNLRDEKHEEEKRCEELEAHRIGADYDKWTNFSCRSTVAVPLPHTFTAPNDIKVVVSYDLSAVRQLVPASQFFEEELKIKRFRSFCSREDALAENTFLWVQEQYARGYPIRESFDDDTVEDLSHPALIALAASMVHPYDMAEESSSKSYGGWWDGPDFGEAWLPDLPHIDPHSFAVIYFEVLGTLIDNETGIWNALQPLLERSGKDLSRIEALGLYFEAEEEVKERAASDKPLLQQCYEEFALRLGLTWASSESSAFASSIASWLLCPGALEWIRKLHPHLSLVALIDIDAQSLSSCTAFSLLRPYFSETMMQFDHEKLKVPSTGQCIVSSSLYWGIEPARWVDVPGVWLRLPGSLAATAPDEPDGRDQWGGHELCILSWRECYGLEKLAPLLLGKEEHTTAEVKGDDALDLVELSRVDSGYASA